MKRGLVGGLVGLFLVTALLLLVSFNLTKSRVLVLHSAARSNGWAQRMDEGMRDVLKLNRRPVLVQWHYLGMERVISEEERQEAALQAKRAIAQLRPDMVLAVDDEAQVYVAQHYAVAAVAAASPQAAPPETRIVFAAIDHPAAEYGYDQATNVTGILERLPLPAVREALTTLRSGQAARIAVIGLADKTGRGQIQQVQAFDWGPHRLVAALTLPDFEAWKAAIQQLQAQADVLVVLSFDGLPLSAGAAQRARMTDIAAWIETHAKPLPIGIDSGFVAHGGGLAIAPSPREMGEVAMRQVLAWQRALDDGQSRAPAVVGNTQYRVAVRESALRARGVALPSIYLEAARLDQLYFP